MEENYFIENNKFISLTGILNRRNFIVNYLILAIIDSLIVSTPLIYLLCTNPDIMLDFSLNAMKTNAFPLWWTIWIGITGLIEVGLFFPSIVRRVRDIIGEVDENRIQITALILAVIIFVGYTPINQAFPICRWFSLCVFIFLMCINGKISAGKPKSEIAKFNWGACFGTWMWGLFNKTPLTLYMLPLLLTTGWFPFMIICGIKGNEWAYENNKKYSGNIQKFHKSQSNQSAIWAVITPVIVVFAGLVLFIFSGILMYDYAKSHPDFVKNMDKKAQEYQNAAVKTNFQKVELTNNEYKFYMEPAIWVKLPDNSRKSMFKIAQGYIKTEKNIDISKDKDGTKSVEIFNKIKIYSTFNNELLGEYYIEPETVKESYSKILKKEKGSFKNYMRILDSGYKFNLHPTLP